MNVQPLSAPLEILAAALGDRSPMMDGLVRVAWGLAYAVALHELTVAEGRPIRASLEARLRALDLLAIYLGHGAGVTLSAETLEAVSEALRADETARVARDAALLAQRSGS